MPDPKELYEQAEFLDGENNTYTAGLLRDAADELKRLRSDKDWINEAIEKERKFFEEATDEQIKERINNMRRPLSKPEWIPVEEKLPKPGTNVLGYDPEHQIGFARYGPRHIEADWIINNQPSNSVTHWKPLPEPPNEQ